jgi:capsular exopolysaccharide synthesis family protein
LLTTLTPANPKVLKKDEEIAFLTSEFQKERDNVLGQIKSDYDTAVRQEKLLQSAFAGQTGQVLSQADTAVQYKLLNRETEILRAQLNNFLQQSNQAGAVSALPANSVRVIDPAQSPSVPYKPNSFQRVSYDLTLGAGFGCLLALARGKYLKSRTARKFAAPGHSSALLQVPELGVIPSAGFRSGKKNGWSKPWKHSVPWLGQNGESKEAGNGELELIGAHDSPSLLADSFRLMVVSITLMNKDSNSNAFLVTSPGPAEGKTTLISNLAVVMAETGRRVLLVDMDLRKPRLHHLFGVDPSRGFTDLITGDAPMDRATIEDYIQTTKVPGVSILPSGTPLDIKSINQLFYSPRVAAFMKIVRKMMDIVLIDAPPMMQFSEARLMASMADRVILVLRSGSTDRGTALTCQQRLAEDGANLLGTILNDWNPGASDMDYTSYYSYYHHQAEGK